MPGTHSYPSSSVLYSKISYVSFIHLTFDDQHLHTLSSPDFFTIDFCYYVNVMYFWCIASHALAQSPAHMSVVQSWIGKTTLRDVNTFLLRVLFANTTGPLLSAVWVWKNSAVFHSLDKMTSLFIHIIPALLSFTQRWYVVVIFQSPFTSHITLKHTGTQTIPCPSLD